MNCYFYTAQTIVDDIAENENSIVAGQIEEMQKVFADSVMSEIEYQQQKEKIE